MSAEQPAHMFGYWADKKGIKAALEQYYPDALCAERELQVALFQLKSAERTIVDHFKRRAEAEEEAEPNVFD
jgi:hypothetical protein